MKRIWILSEHYYPEETATGHILSHIGEGLTDEFEVRVITAQPTYHQRGFKAPAKELHNGVLINRCWSTNLDRNVIWKRLINLITISLSIFLSAVFRIGKGDMVLVVTNPPLLPFLTRFAAWLRRARVVLLVHDVYPEVMVASGITTDDKLLVKAIRWANNKLFSSMDHIAVLGRDMKALILLKLGAGAANDSKVTIIPNWAEIAEIEPADRASNALLNELGLLDKFVIQYAGNMGFVHDVETIIAAAAELRDLPDVHFLFIGSGAKQDWLEQEVERHGLENVTRIGQQPRSEQKSFLNACDIAIMALLPGMLGVSVPCRSYNILAAGKPILGLLNKESEIALMIEEESVGWVVEPENTAELVSTIRKASQDREAIRAFRERARTVVEEKYTAEHALQKFRDVFKAVATS